MEIHSADERFKLGILPDQHQGELCFEISMTVTGQTGTWSGTNREMVFFNQTTFLADLDRFILDRSLRPTLTGDDDLKLEFYRLEESRNHVWLGFSFGDCPHHASVSLRGAFEIDQSDLLRILDDFRRLFSPW